MSGRRFPARSSSDDDGAGLIKAAGRASNSTRRPPTTARPMNRPGPPSDDEREAERTVSFLRFTTELSWPIMAPRRPSLIDIKLLSGDQGKLAGYHWQKDFIQSRIMQKVHDVGGKMNAQTWLEQMRMLVKERPISFACVLFLILLCCTPIILLATVLAASCCFSIISFLFFEGTLLTIGSLLVTGLFVVVTCVAFPVVLFLGVAYVGASFAMGLFARLSATTSSSFKGIAEVRRRFSTTGSDTSCPDGSAFLPPCIVDSDASALRRRHSNGHHCVEDVFHHH